LLASSAIETGKRGTGSNRAEVELRTALKECALLSGAFIHRQAIQESHHCERGDDNRRQRKQ
jgi:hypothetical protein